MTISSHSGQQNQRSMMTISSHSSQQLLCKLNSPGEWVCASKNKSMWLCDMQPRAAAHRWGWLQFRPSPKP